jgi:anti-sigma regulatory factor (Ser/Thr protein kinase)
VTTAGHPAVSVRLTAEPASARAARRFVAGTLEEWGCEGLSDVATLLVSELVSNVVLHARTELAVTVRRLPTAVRVEVHDGASAPPARRHYAPDAATGRGLGMVEDLAGRWGTVPSGSGKTVWFELDEDSAARFDTPATVEWAPAGDRTPREGEPEAAVGQDDKRGSGPGHGLRASANPPVNAAPDFMALPAHRPGRHRWSGRGGRGVTTAPAR